MTIIPKYIAYNETYIMFRPWTSGDLAANKYSLENKIYFRIPCTRNTRQRCFGCIVTFVYESIYVLLWIVFFILAGKLLCRNFQSGAPNKHIKPKTVNGIAVLTLDSPNVKVRNWLWWHRTTWASVEWNDEIWYRWTWCTEKLLNQVLVTLSLIRFVRVSIQVS